ncbi:putative hydrolase of the HAD superfamily [Salegentibacter holothuriorum]|uniref:Putative hydrolase of the HAD superfamily n=1 Tax=Salegentibacter holothuriorum TaxID=241145 RepID=A0A1T5B0F1_9FLAO|nr:HAD family phosphatase [Salegentibacter holothuriorum]SKB40791.1 putative hydrolase of the HAD superfamily [Salegentibacter holothuriorum]
MIKTLIFDFGDVFVNLDKPATMREMNKHKIETLSENLLQVNQQYEKGLISSTAFVKSYQTEHPELQENQFKDSWNAILIDFPEYRYQFLKKLSEEQTYRLILLSNTNEIHIDWIKDNVPFFEDFKACFDAFYLSHEINFRKPDAEIYEFVLQQHNLEPQECLFIDDTKENTEAAKNLGIHTWNIDPAQEDVVDLFTARKELF